MKKKLISTLLCMTMLAALLVGCAQTEATTTTAAEGTTAAAVTTEAAAETTAAPAAKTYKIGVAMKQNADTFVQKISDAITARGEELPDVEILMQDAEGDVATQLSQVEAFITQGVDAIILNAMDAEGLNPAVEMCIEAGIPLVECNTLTTNENYTCYVGSDDVDAGKIQGNFLKGVLPEDAKVCIMYGPIGQSPQIKRIEGLTASLLDGSKIEVLQDQTANWKREEALALAEDWLTRYPDLDAIICQNDDMAMGAMQAVQSAGRQDSVIVVGIDAIEDALQAVKDGTLACTVFQDASGQGATAVDVALQLAKGETVEKSVMIPFQLVTTDNVADFMK